jgi:hypothetical protein
MNKKTAKKFKTILGKLEDLWASVHRREAGHQLSPTAYAEALHSIGHARDLVLAARRSLDQDFPETPIPGPVLGEFPATAE